MFENTVSDISENTVSNMSDDGFNLFNNGFSYIRTDSWWLMDFVDHSKLGLRVIKKKEEEATSRAIPVKVAAK